MYKNPYPNKFNDNKESTEWQSKDFKKTAKILNMGENLLKPQLT